MAMLSSREKLKALEDNFQAFIAPLLDEKDTEDVSMEWEFKKYLHGKRLRVLTAENQGLKKWKETLLSK